MNSILIDSCDTLLQRKGDRDEALDSNNFSCNQDIVMPVVHQIF